MKPAKMEQHRLKEILGALREPPRITVAQWGNATVYDLMAHIAALEAEAARLADIAARSALLARERALEQAETRVAMRRDQFNEGSRSRAVLDAAVSDIRTLKSKPVHESEPGVADYCPEARKCTSKRCVTCEGRTIHALGCKLSESFESDPGEKVEP